MTSLCPHDLSRTTLIGRATRRCECGAVLVRRAAPEAPGGYRYVVAPGITGLQRLSPRELSVLGRLLDDAEKGDFDPRYPLTQIILRLEMVKKNLDKPEAVREIDTALEAVNRAFAHYFKDHQ